MSQTQAILRLLNIQYPIIQAPMLGVSTPQLAAAVSNVGALGSIALSSSNAEQARALIRACRALTTRPFNVNLFCHTPAIADEARESAWLNYLSPFFAEFGAQPPASIKDSAYTFLGNEATFAMLLEERPAVVSFHFGIPPADWIRALGMAGIVTLACATTVEEAQQIEAAGVNAVIAQGVEAGGHRGVFNPKADSRIGTFALVQLISQHVRIPVIAAGGIMNGRSIAGALRLGAAAVQMGTAFILCPESAANAAYRAALQSTQAYHTEISAVISGRPARGLVNRLFTDVDRPNAPALPDYPIAYEASKALSALASSHANLDFAIQWAGQAAPLARAMPAAELVETLVREWQAETA